MKAFLPAVAALPLVAVRAGHTWLTITCIGRFDFWIFYPLFLVPAGVMVAANAVNMLAGFNGMEVGMGLVAMGSLAVIAAIIHETTALIILLAGAGALLVRLRGQTFIFRISSSHQSVSLTSTLSGRRPFRAGCRAQSQKPEELADLATLLVQLSHYAPVLRSRSEVQSQQSTVDREP